MVFVQETQESSVWGSPLLLLIVLAVLTLTACSKAPTYTLKRLRSSKDLRRAALSVSQLLRICRFSLFGMFSLRIQKVSQTISASLPTSMDLRSTILFSQFFIISLIYASSCICTCRLRSRSDQCSCRAVCSSVMACARASLRPYCARGPNFWARLICMTRDSTRSLSLSSSYLCSYSRSLMRMLRREDGSEAQEGARMEGALIRLYFLQSNHTYFKSLLIKGSMQMSGSLLKGFNMCLVLKSCQMIHSCQIMGEYLILEQKSMCEAREEYSCRMGSIESKFRLICQRYHELTQQLAIKDATVQEMTQQIARLQSKLQAANTTIAQLQKQVSNFEQAQTFRAKLNDQPSASTTEIIETDPLPATQITKQASITANRLPFPRPYRQRSQQFVPSEESALKPIVNGEDEKFDDVLRKLKQKIASKPFIPTAPAMQKPHDSTPVSIQSQSQSRGLLSRVKSVENMRNQPVVSVQNIKTLQSIWQERDSEISKMDELFENINNRLKDYEH